DSLFTGHMNNIKRLAKENKLIVAGPFEKNLKNYRGLFIFTVNNSRSGFEYYESVHPHAIRSSSK
ncbi:MAG TPA: hypothetical protein VK590_03990, partial [Saprospiraceae bacterium]|nr:hypothetical protein [Saprospiraceae bacterium]